ncbi:MAG TPA: hypothetical protein VHB20_03115 [Verrucomicrobiae bacterium]|nr:hypothetical protein [Verrucomicrobiae bacterium]
MRGDGLGIHHPTNHTFEFLLGAGWLAYLGCSLAYLVAATLLVSIVPRRLALMIALACIFGHYFGASNWLASRWRTGFGGTLGYGTFLSYILGLAISDADDLAGPAAGRRLRWVMMMVIAADFTVTLLGQPASFWPHPETCREGDAVVRVFLSRGWAPFLALTLTYASFMFSLATRLPRTPGLICALSVIFCHFAAVSNWLFYEWRLGMESPVLYGLLLAVAIVAGLDCHRAQPETPAPSQFSASRRFSLCS